MSALSIEDTFERAKAEGALLVLAEIATYRLLQFAPNDTRVQTIRAEVMESIATIERLNIVACGLPLIHSGLPLNPPNAATGD